ncbi:hypothetical protein CICLE_v10002156mg [Citrus x clementina]|uniref:Myb-like domain-containing protein n=1 Tax=Citrus clementina TaxID=85681 RepID=V4SEL7_CITCL|nr:hypothetical protein CICLE_v10002156mg [Citrus x clementina]
MMTSSSSSAHAQAVQWGNEETRDLIVIRGETERDLVGIKRNKTIWEIVSVKLRERGYSRTPDQCKCKWKNLVNRYKAKKRFKRLNADELSDEEDDDEEQSEEEEEEEERPARGNSRKRKIERNVSDKSPRATSGTAGIHEMLKAFFDQQQRMEVEWRQMMERRAQERQLFEEEWRQRMEKLERERLLVEQAWREKEEQRRIREESRAERRDALLTTLLTKLINQNNP